MAAVLPALIAAGIAGLATGVGALPLFFYDTLPRRAYDALLGACAGLMLSAATLGLLGHALEAVRNAPGNIVKLARGFQVAGRRTGQIFSQELLAHYSQTLQEIHQTGYLRYWAREFRPYLLAAVENFSPRRRSLTQRLLRR